MTDYIYSRVSTKEQNSESQLLNLRNKYPNAKIFNEIASGAKKRPILGTLINELQCGDRLIVAALDRLGRKTVEILGLIENLEKRGIILISDREGIDYSTITGRLVTQILVSIAEMERNLLSERTKAGLKAAKANGRLGGRPKVYSQKEIAKALEILGSGLTSRQVARKTGISYSYLNYLRRKFQI